MSDVNTQGCHKCGYLSCNCQVYAMQRSRLKIKPEHYEYMKAKIEAIDRKVVRQKLIHSKAVPKNFERRFRWDCLYAAGLSKWICDNLYPYMNDDHITNALNQIFKEIPHA